MGVLIRLFILKFDHELLKYNNKNNNICMVNNFVSYSLNIFYLRGTLGTHFFTH